MSTDGFSHLDNTENSDILIKKNNLSEKNFSELKNFFENPEQINFRNENFLNEMVDL